MTTQRLYLLLSVFGDDGLHEAWDEDWDFLLDYGFIDMESDDSIPDITAKGKKAIEIAVTAIGALA